MNNQLAARLHNKTGIDKLIEIMAILRDPEYGCPWDRKQTFASIVPHTIEEAYEVADAIYHDDMAQINAELGDLLFQVVFYAQLGKEQHAFDFTDIADTMCDKLIRRHPHVFGDVHVNNESDIKANWENIKRQERMQKSSQSTIMDDIPNALPALSRSYKIQKRAAQVGFDWPNIGGALAKVKEEIEELEQEIQRPDFDPSDPAVAEELGDLYFALTNVTRHLKLKPEAVVSQANQKFIKRFSHMEQLASSQHQRLDTLSLNDLDLLWEQVKQLEK